MASKGAAGKRRRAASTRARTPVAVEAVERQHLIEACAYFHADRFRPAEPGKLRSADVKAATAEIDAVLGGHGRRKGGKRK